MNSYPNGCCFTIFGKSLCTVPNDLQTNFMPCQTSLLADKCHKTVESVTQPQEPEMWFISGKFNFSPHQTEHKTQQDIFNEKKRRRSEMRNYRAKIKCKKVSETDRRLKLDAQKSYMKECRKKKSANTNDIDKLKNRASAKQNNYSRQYGKKKLLSINETEKLKKKRPRKKNT